MKERYYFIADMWYMWTMSPGPILLRQRFQNPVYYTHFVALVHLLHLCLQFEIYTDDIDTIEAGMASWVQEFEKLYYQYNLDRLPVCTLPIHGLLHIAVSIRIMGPSWCYWAYPMERFCGSLLPAIKSRRFPWASIDRRILELAQLFQLKTIYSLSTTLDLRPCQKLEKSGMSLAAYPRCVLIYPWELRPISDTLHTKIAKHLTSCYDATSAQILPLIASPLEHWGKIQWLEGGDMMHASEIGKHGTRDMTHVKFNGKYGQLRLLLVVKLEPSEILKTTTTKIHLLAVVAPSVITQKNRLNMLHTKVTSTIDLVFISEGTLGKLLEKCVVLPSHGSDHSLISCSFAIPFEHCTPCPRRNFRGADWEAWPDLLDDHLAPHLLPPLPLRSPADVDAFAEAFTARVVTVLEAHITLTRVSPHTRHWWNGQLTALRHEYNAAHRAIAKDDPLIPAGI
ncbi:hypothetical protein B0H13DRAFT_2302339 [Mycena leptocephala]|nr:hypothetical protein B0H13DRAFT_2302339 [Mycena leptocephala]